MREEKAGESFDARLAGESPVELVAEVAEGGAAVERHDAGGVEEGGAGGEVEFVVELAGELFDGVFGGDEADGGTVLVDDDGDLAAALLELLEEFDGFSLVSGTTSSSRMT